MEKFLNWFQRHRIIRGLMCFVLACLVCFNVMVNPLVEAHAIVITASLLMAAGTLLAAIGITFATNEALQKGAATFYNGCANVATNVKSFLDEQATKMTVGAAYSMIVPVAIANASVNAAKQIFPANSTAVEDTSGIGAPAWKAFVGSTITQMVSGTGSQYARSMPIALTLNKIPSYSPDIGSPIITMDASAVSLSNQSNDIDNINTNLVTRFTGISGKTYDYRFYVVQTSAGLVVNLSENGVYLGRSVCPFTGTLRNFKLASYVSIVQNYDREVEIFLSGSCEYIASDEITHVSYLQGFRVVSMTDTDIGHHLSRESTFGGVVDGNSGVVAIPQVGYLPDQSICASNAIKDALDKLLAQNPAYPGISVSVPAAEADLINASWEKVVATQQDYINALREAIDALENTKPGEGEGDKPGTITGDVTISMGNVALPNLTIPAMVTTVFPFCIPFDVVRAFDVLTAPPKAPRFVIPLKYGKVLDEEIVLELGAFDGLVKFIRWGELFIYTVGLAVATRQFIKW